MTDDLGAVLEALHADKSVLLRSQHASIAVEVAERQRIASMLTRSLQEEILDIGSTILNLTRPEQPDLYLRERVTMEDQRRNLTRDLRTEQLAAWQDVQELKREQRLLAQELVQATQRRQRLEDVGAPGPV